MATFNGTIEVRENPVTSAKTYSRTFERSAGAKDSGYSDLEFSHRADGGYYRARFMIKGPRAEMSEFMQDGLGREVVIVGNDGKRIWEGYVHKMEYDAGRVAYSADLGALSNSVWLRYRVRGASTTSRSTTQSDTDSIANYGTKQFILSGGELESAAVADSIAMQYLNNHKAPSGAPTRIDPEKELAEFPTISIECRGWFDTLNWKTYNQTTATDSQGASAQITDIIGTRGITSFKDPAVWDKTADFEEGTSADADAISPDWDQSAGEATADFDSTVIAGTSNLVASTDAVKIGTNGFLVTYGNGSAYGRFTSVASLETFVVFEGWFNFDGLTMTSGNSFILAGENSPFDCALRVNQSGAVKYFDVFYNLDVGSGTLGSSVLSPASGWDHARVVWKASSGAGNDDGYARLYLNGILVDQDLGLDNDTKTIAAIDFGLIAGVDAGTSGTFHMDQCQWSDGPGSPAWITEGAALSGTYGAAITIEDTTARYAEFTGPTDDTDFVPEFEFDPNGLTMASGDEFVMASGIEAGGGVDAWQIVMQRDGTDYRIRARARLDGGSYTEGEYIPIDDQQYIVRVVWGASGGTNDGYLYLILNGGGADSLEGLDNDTLNVDTFRVGAVSGLDAGTSGVMFFDDVRWADEDAVDVILETGVGQFVKSSSIQPNATLVSKEYDADRRGGDIIQDIARLGDSTNSRWVAYMDDDRAFRFEPAAPAVEQ